MAVISPAMLLSLRGNTILKASRQYSKKALKYF
jgi:hypothetical protein